jgi:rod shape-determining protein MreD
VNTPWRSMRRDERLAWTVGHWRAGLPFLVTVVVTLAMTVPLVAPMPLLPHFPLLFVIVWTAMLAGAMPAWAALFIGILTDAALGLPVGINAALLPLTVVALTALEARFGSQRFPVEWGAAAALILLYQLLSWQLLRFVLGDLPLTPALIQAATSALAYPLVVAVAAAVRRRMARP